jgi:hypothetical protein
VKDLKSRVTVKHSKADRRVEAAETRWVLEGTVGAATLRVSRGPCGAGRLMVEVEDRLSAEQSERLQVGSADV